LDTTRPPHLSERNDFWSWDIHISINKNQLKPRYIEVKVEYSLATRKRARMLKKYICKYLTTVANQTQPSNEQLFALSLKNKIMHYLYSMLNIFALNKNLNYKLVQSSVLQKRWRFFFSESKLYGSFSSK